jgi:hypothetical protein
VKKSIHISTETVETHMFTEVEIVAALLPTVPVGATIDFKHDVDEQIEGRWVNFPICIRVITKTTEEK